MLKKLAPCALAMLCLSVLSLGSSSTKARLSDLPDQAQNSISASLGLDLPQYHARKTREGYETENLRQGLTTQFTATGVDIRTGHDHWKMALQSYGYGTKFRLVRQVSPRVAGNRIEYQRGLLTEWYINGPFGLEQGFTLKRQPQRSNGGPLRVTFALSGSLKAAAEDRNSLKLTRSNGSGVLRYAGLTARDASGKELAAVLVIKERKELRLEIDDSAAQYPVTVDPTIQNFTLTASDGMDNDQFGTSVAIDGNTAVVGALLGGQGGGAAYVFVRPPGGWANMTETAELTPSDPQDAGCFGCSVAISGNTIVVGASSATINGSEAQGAAYVFVEPPTGWTNMTETAKLTASDGAFASSFGTGVGICGNTIVAGAPSFSSNPIPGKAYIFVEPEGGWKNLTQTAELLASDGFDLDNFGTSVSISGDTAVVGAPDRGSGSARVGQGYVFVKPPSGWADMNETAKLTASDGKIGYAFGLSVSLSGTTAVVGAPAHPKEGAVYVFVEPDGGWTSMTQTAGLIGASGGGCLGWSTSIDGDVIVAGSQCSFGLKGIALVFVKPRGGWRNSSRPKLKLSIPFSEPEDSFGVAVGISGTTGIIGAPTAPTSPPCCTFGPGEAFVFTEK
jgi:hypothetical protein